MGAGEKKTMTFRGHKSVVTALKYDQKWLRQGRLNRPCAKGWEGGKLGFFFTLFLIKNACCWYVCPM